MINNVVIMGRLTATPEIRSTQTGTSVTAFTVAVERNFTKQGEQRQSDFIECVAWKNTAEFICNYFEKGQMIAVTGSIQTRNYEDKNGNKRKAVEVLVSQASFCGSKNETTHGVSSQDTDDFEEIGSDDDSPF